MLILAGTSINAIVGDNGLLRKSQDAKLTAEEASRRETLEFLLLDYNTSKFLDEANGLGKYLEGLVTSGELEGFAATTDGDYAIITYKGKTYEVERQTENSEYYKVLDEVTGDLGDINGNYILTQKTLDTEDNFAFEDGKSYIVMDENLKGDDFEFNIPDNSEITIKILYDMTIDNQNCLGRSAINLGHGSILNLYVYGTVTVTSGFGAELPVASTEQSKGGTGGYAGIHVPWTDFNEDGIRDEGEYATLNLYGTGTLVAYGGDAGDGAGTITNTIGGGGGGGAGAGIGGNGGTGGDSCTTCAALQYITNSGHDGLDGENCGKVVIYDDLEIYAYGGAGGSGGANISGSASGGGGGYPAAGIGRRRSWRRWRRPRYWLWWIFSWWTEILAQMDITVMVHLIIKEMIMELVEDIIL